MEHFILHFLTGTMAFRVPRASRRRNDAEIPDAFVSNTRLRKNQDAGKAAKNVPYARRMQDGTTKHKKRSTTPVRTAKNKPGRNGFGERLGGASGTIRKVTDDATTAKQSRASSTAMQRKLRIGGRAEYQACGANGRSDEQSHALAAGI